MEELIKMVMESIAGAIFEEFRTTGKEKYDKRKLEKEFIRIGEFLGGFEKTQTDGFISDLSAVFSKDNMKYIFGKVSGMSGFSLQGELKKELGKLCAKYEVGKEQQEYFIESFCRMFLIILEQADPPLAQAMFSGAFQTMVGERMDVLEQQICSILEKQERGKEPEAGEESEAAFKADNYDSKQIEWELWHGEIKGLFGTADEQKAELLTMTSRWKEERNRYPGWYILPFRKRRELEIDTCGEGILQRKDAWTLDQRFDYIFELLWRYEKAFLPYNDFILRNACEVWKLMEEKQLWRTDERKTNWEQMGLFLLREYRERLDEKSWTVIHDGLRKHEESEHRMMERMKFEDILMDFSLMRISAAVKRMNEIQLDPDEYGLRLRLYSLKAECGMQPQALAEIEKLTDELRNAVSTAGKAAAEEGSVTEGMERSVNGVTLVYLNSLLACSLNVQSYLLQAVHPFDDSVMDRISDCYRESEALSKFYSFEEAENECVEHLLAWREKKKTQPLFELNRESMTIIRSSDSCTEAYVFYRILEQSGLPLRMGRVTLFRSHETSLLESLMDWYPELACFLLLRSGNDKAVEACFTRLRLASWDRRTKNRIFKYIYQALSDNLNEIRNYNLFWDGNVYTSIITCAVTALKRMVAVATASQQTELLALLKQLIEVNAVKKVQNLDSFMEAVLKSAGEHSKAGMLNALLECSTKTRTHAPDGLRNDPFDLLGIKEQALPLYQQVVVEHYLIEDMFRQAGNSDADRRAMIARLTKLFEWGLLTKEQEGDLGSLLWGSINPETQLPDLDNYYLWVFLKWPCPDGIDAGERIRRYLLDERRCEELCERVQINSMQDIFYPEQIWMINDNIENFWAEGEADRVINYLYSYWTSGKMRWEKKEQAYSFEEKLFYNRYNKVVTTIRSFSNAEIVRFSEETLDRLRQMCGEMNKYGIPSLEVEVALPENRDSRVFVSCVADALYEADERTSVSAARAVEEYLRRYPESGQCEYLLTELVKVIRARKEPGLLSFIISLHNIIYRRESPFADGILDDIEKALVAIEKQTDYSRSDTEWELKRNLEIRSQAAALAFRLYIYEEKCGKGNAHSNATNLWQDVCCGIRSKDEFAEVRNAWVQI